MSGFGDAVYRLLLKLFPRRTRVAYGDEMARLFAEQRLSLAGRPLARAWLWTRAVVDLVRHGCGARWGRARVSGAGTPARFSVQQTVRFAWRNVAARRWRAALSAGLLCIALAANTLLFAMADSVVLHRSPYEDPGRLVEIQRHDARGRRDAILSAPLLDEWRRQTDLFSGVHGYLWKNLFLTGGGEPELVPTTDVTVGLIELLGGRPRWGRSFVEGDERQLDLQPVLISASLAAERFGDPARAVQQRLETTGEPLLVVGVMGADFRFPDGRQRIWRAIDPRGPLVRNGVSGIARLNRGPSMALAAGAMAQRSEAIGRAAGLEAPYLAQPGPLPDALARDEDRRLFLLLLGAAVSLLLIACANVASVELATAVDRARVCAIQLALGASRTRLAAVAAVEGLILIGPAVLLGGVLAHLGADVVAHRLPARLADSTPNTIDIDARGLLFMAGIAAVAWVLTSLPVVVFASRGRLLDLLKVDGYAVTASRRSGMLRRALTIGQVAAAIVLLVGGVAYIRSYQALVAQDKGFDSSGVVTIGLTIPPQAYASQSERVVLRAAVLEQLRARPGVLAVSASPPPPQMGQRFAVRQMEIAGQAPVEEDIILAQLEVEPDYFAVLRIPLIAGRMFAPGDPPTDVIVSESFARRYWPDGGAVGQSYRAGSKFAWQRIIGVAAHVRSALDPPGGRSDRALQTYFMRQPPPPPPIHAAAPPRRVTGDSFSQLNVLARVDSGTRVADLRQTIRAIDASFILKMEFVNDVYERQFEDRLLLTRVIGGFGLLALAIAVAGIYGVMTFLVSQRTREIGVRVALGATRRDITRLVLGSSMRLVGAGALLGLAASALSARWVQSQIYGVSALDPAAILAIAALVVSVALLASWRPAHRAAHVDPTALLRG